MRHGRKCRSNGYSLSFVGSQCSEPVPTARYLRNDTTVPGVRLPALIRRRPVPVSTFNSSHQTWTVITLLATRGKQPTG
jgi:hypothetical protein